MNERHMMVRWPHRCPWKAVAQGFQLLSQFLPIWLWGIGRGLDFGKNNGEVINLFVHNTKILMKSFLWGTLLFQWFLTFLPLSL